MILVRLGYLSELPSAEDLLADVQGRPKLPSKPVEVVVPAPQPNAPMPTPPPSEIKMPATFEEVLELVIQAREPILHSHLAHDVHLVDYKPGHVLIRLADNAPETIPQRLRQILETATKTSWTIELSEKAGGETVVHQQKEVKKQSEEAARNHPLVESIVEAFPGSTVTVK